MQVQSRFDLGCISINMSIFTIVVDSCWGPISQLMEVIYGGYSHFYTISRNPLINPTAPPSVSRVAVSAGQSQVRLAKSFGS